MSRDVDFVAQMPYKGTTVFLVAHQPKGNWAGANRTGTQQVDVMMPNGVVLARRSLTAATLRAGEGPARPSSESYRWPLPASVH